MHIITGGAGFIGSALVWALNQRGIDDILVVDNLGKTDKWRNLAKRQLTKIIHKDEFVPWLKHQGERITVDSITHMGACSSTTERDVDYLIRNNVAYSQSLFEYCTEKKVPFIYASSAATYGNGELGYADGCEQMKSLRPINPYGYSKKIFDDWVLRQTDTPPFWAGLKFFNVYGPQEYHKGHMQSLCAKAVPQIQQTKSLKLFKSYRQGISDGEQMRDFVYVKDVVKVILHLLDGQKQITSSIYNCGTGCARSFADLGRSVFAAMGIDAKFDWIEMPPEMRGQYQYFTEASLEKLRKDAGYTEDFHSLESGIEDYVKNYLLTDDGYL